MPKAPGLAWSRSIYCVPACFSRMETAAQRHRGSTGPDAGPRDPSLALGTSLHSKGSVLEEARPVPPYLLESSSLSPAQNWGTDHPSQAKAGAPSPNSGKVTPEPLASLGGEGGRGVQRGGTCSGPRDSGGLIDADDPTGETWRHRPKVPGHGKLLGAGSQHSEVPPPVASTLPPRERADPTTAP